MYIFQNTFVNCAEYMGSIWELYGFLFSPWDEGDDYRIHVFMVWVFLFSYFIFYFCWSIVAMLYYFQVYSQVNQFCVDTYQLFFKILFLYRSSQSIK